MSLLTIQLKENVFESLMSYARMRKQTLQTITEEALESYIAMQLVATETDDAIVGMMSLGSDASMVAKDVAKQSLLAR